MTKNFGFAVLVDIDWTASFVSCPARGKFPSPQGANMRGQAVHFGHEPMSGGASARPPRPQKFSEHHFRVDLVQHCQHPRRRCTGYALIDGILDLAAQLSILKSVLKTEALMIGASLTTSA